MTFAEIDIIISIIAVVFVFLFGVTKFSKQMEYIAGDRLKIALEHFTRTPVRGFLTGTIVTSIVQSSTVVTVLIVSLVHAGLMSFRNSIGAILGANIGTALSTSLIAFRILDLAPYVLVIGFILMKLKNKYQHHGKSVFYLGLILSSLFLMSVLVAPLKESALFMGLISHTSSVIVAVLVGIILTTILQSSTVVSGIVIILAGQGVLELLPAFAIVLGANIGTTSTAVIAAALLDKQAKRAALAHFMFSFIGVLITLPFIGFVVDLLSKMPGTVAHQVAIGHLIFNIVFALLFLIFVKTYTRVIERILP